MIPPSAGSGALPPFVEPAVQRGRTLLVGLVWVTGVVGALGIIGAAAIIGSIPGATLAIVYGLIPLPLLFLMFWWIDRVEPEPLRYKVAAFVWGGVIAVVIAIGLEGLAALAGLPENLQIAFVAPLVEETTKGLFLLLVFTRNRRVISGPLDGILVAGLVAIGFASVENVAYYAASYLGIDEAFPISGAEAATATFIVRGIASPLAHPLFTCALGLAVGIAVKRRSVIVKALLVTGGFIVSVGFHAMWNGSIVFTGAAGFIIVYLVLALILLGLIILVAILRSHELDVLQNSLGLIARSGWMHPDEVPYLVRFGKRRLARNYANRSGTAAREAMIRYQKLASETAFLHVSLRAGQRIPRGQERLEGLLEQMWILRPWLRFPPALPPQFYRQP